VSRSRCPRQSLGRRTCRWSFRRWGGRRVVRPPRWLRHLAHRGCRGGPQTHTRMRPVPPSVPYTRHVIGSQLSRSSSLLSNLSNSSEHSTPPTFACWTKYLDVYVTQLMVCVSQAWYHLKYLFPCRAPCANLQKNLSSPTLRSF
jgi:hypothetical protein